MTTSQLTVSAIRQHFESTSYLNTRAKHDKLSKIESESVIKKKKQPPKTRPKPKTSVVVAAQSCDAVTSHGVSQSVANVVSQHETQPSRSVDDECIDTANVFPLSGINSASSSSHITLACEDTASSRLVRHAQNLPLDDAIQTTRVLAKSASRDEVDIMRPSVKRTMPNRWASTSNLMSNTTVPAANDVEEAINRAKQKPVLYRILGMKLESESLPQQIYKAASDHALPHTPTSLAATDDRKPSAASTDDVDLPSSSPTDHGSTSDDVTSQPNPLADALVQTAVTEHNTNTTICETLSSDQTAIRNEENGSIRTELATGRISRHASEQTRRPISLYPQEMQQLASADTDNPLTATDVHSSVPNAHDNWTLETLQPDSQPTSPAPLRNVQRSPTENTVNVSSIKQPQVATSRKSYIALKEFVLEKFSFLDNTEDTAQTHVNISDCDAWADADSTADPDISAGSTAAEDRTQHSQNTEMTVHNERPKSLPRRSFILQNGEILEIVGNAFMFLDDYDVQTADDCAC